MKTPLPWWQSDEYFIDGAVPADVHNLAGPQGIAMVKAWPSGLTDPGWGLQGANGGDGFILRYNRGEFNDRRVLHGYNKGLWTFAFIMRSVRLVCIDIDGKNGGLEHAKRLGMLPHTLAETSKSGDGYHLFYTVDEKWDEVKGYGMLADRIGVEQGVDIRATGCVYHHPQQRWNTRPAVPLPEHLKKLLLHREQKIAAVGQRIDKVLGSQDELEILMMKDEILSDLEKPIPLGKRNITLFAIGNQMRQAQIEKWDELLADKAQQVGLPIDEIDKLVNNIEKYGSANP